VSYCGLTAAFRSSAGKQQRGPLSKQRNAWLQTTLIEAAKLAPRWNPQLAQLHAQQLEYGHANRATLQVAPELLPRTPVGSVARRRHQTCDCEPCGGVLEECFANHRDSLL
jgi:hypothetical protein